MKLKFRTKGVVLGIILVSLNIYGKSLASDLSITDQNKMLGAVAKEWESSNLREWLNSDKLTVDYTCLPPSYKNEAGFLSDRNFTQEERDAIAITKHGGGWQYSIGNLNDTLYVSQRGVAHNDFQYNDKVFILHYTDLVNYIERNNELLKQNTKYYSNYIQNTTNKLDKYPYLVNSGYVNSNYVNTTYLYSSILTSLRPSAHNNIVPALSLKPEYILSNGVKAKDLDVGSNVTFGRYNGEPIEWQVINKSDNGYPLLWSTKIITTKEYDTPGDINPLKSKYINFNSYDVDIYSGTGQNKSWRTDKPIESIPNIEFENEQDLLTPTNDTSLNLKINATDTYNEVTKIVLPDKKTIEGSSGEFIIGKNGEYTIVAENSEGVINVRHFITKAINTPAEVTITTDKDNSSKWTNKPVNVTVSATNNGVYEIIAKGNKVINYNEELIAGKFPDWMPLGGKKIRIKGTLKNTITDDDIQKYNLNMNGKIKIRIDRIRYSLDSTNWDYPTVLEMSLQELKDAGEIHIDTIYTVPNDYYASAKPYVSLMNGHSDYKREGYSYWVSDFSFEVLDKDDLAIEEITLPDGNIIRNDYAVYTIYKKGVYTFSARDNRGKITSKTIELDVDMETPTLDIDYSKDLTNKNISLKVSAKDGISGIKSVKLPNGEYRTNSSEQTPLSIDYNIISNGNYTFETTDFAGNKIAKTVSVKNIDMSGPTINYTLSPNTWTTGDVSITVSASDNPSGVKKIVLPDGSKVFGNSTNYIVNKNGRYSFMATDNLDNISVIVVNVSNIDKNRPTVSMEKSPSKDWSNTDVYVNINAND